MTTRDHDYRLMVNALARVTRQREEALSAAERAYQDNAARAAGELARAEGEAVDADRWAGAAAAQVLDVDREAARLWDHLRRARGVRMRSLGDLPEPATVEAAPRIALQRDGRAAEPADGSPCGTGPGDPPRAVPPRVLLARAADRIDDTVRPGDRRPLPGWALAALPLFGALLSAVTGLVAAGLVTLGESPAGTGTTIAGATMLRGLGWLAFLVAPSAGVPVAAAVAHRALQARLDIAGIGLTLLGGMVTATMLSLAFAATR
ncbi:hypothetical protein [Mangrovihabitans endophyticus]|uniref:Uncharacterized protein n=1 Tax=Mangrovihabitans endophyticus TaxID=1751298 RepID=A0A8J3FP84_9ACTN|nr:hypothetical protein [Mangrovihabitans endophyticus]GGK99059.1 hypothetical protein GCM10012284_36860 [Mangrovihabitans endophyticus]